RCRSRPARERDLSTWHTNYRHESVWALVDSAVFAAKRSWIPALRNEYETSMPGHVRVRQSQPTGSSGGSPPRARKPPCVPPPARDTLGVRGPPIRVGHAPLLHPELRVP